MTFRHLAVAKSKRTLRLHRKSLLRSMNTIGVGTTRRGGGGAGIFVGVNEKV